MSHQLFSDKRASNLLSRVSEDLSHLRHDVGSLLGHTTRHTLPDSAREIAGSAREIAGSARDRLAAGTSYAASQLRSLRHRPVDPTTGIIAGAALLGLIGLGVYALCKHGCSSQQSQADTNPEEDLDV